MHWAYWNPVRIRFGAGLFNEVAGLIGKRRWALVTYDQPIFRDLAERLAQAAGAPVVTIANIETNPDCADPSNPAACSAPLQSGPRSSSRSAAAR